MKPALLVILLLAVRLIVALAILSWLFGCGAPAIRKGSTASPLDYPELNGRASGSRHAAFDGTHSFGSAGI